PLQHGQRIVLFMKELGDRGVVNVVTFIFQTMDFHQPLRDVFGTSQDRDNRVQLFRHAHNYIGKVPSVPFDFLDVVIDDRPGGVVDEIDNVIERGGHRVNVFAIERSD